ncbi:MAG: helix-turn-helix transcriptional regulator [Nocardioides sp.]|uniref:helix-turn-helix domain-containing protein n=1 Tax=Nocardioides sp. TaxID=35761 RepID=UPI0039E59C2E
MPDQAEGPLDVEWFDVAAGERFEPHTHPKHLLTWAASGSLTLEVENRCWVLPPSVALWIPAGMVHDAVAMRPSRLGGLYVETDASPVAWSAPTVVALTPLALHLMDYLEGGDVSGPAWERATAVLIDVLAPLEADDLELPLPVDRRGRAVADLLRADPREPRGADELAAEVGCSPRTLLRIFLAETGMTFSDWRSHLRILAATAMVRDGLPVATVADLVGYATPSAFVSAFRRITGRTPRMVAYEK